MDGPLRILAGSLLASLLIGGVLALPAVAATQVPITSCGQVVPRRTTGVLVADLDCTGFEGGPFSGAPAVVLAQRSALHLGGFRITVSTRPGETPAFGVLCAEPCRDDATSACPTDCRLVGPGVVQASNQASIGVFGRRVSLRDLAVRQLGDGVHGDKLKLENVLVEANYTGLFGRVVKILASTLTGNTTGAHGSFVVLRDSTAIANGIDFISGRRPVVKNSYCETSGTISGRWYVCLLD